MSLFNYFSKLGTVYYNGSIVSNVITSIRFKQLVDEREIIYYPYVVREGERPEQIAFHYYNDERYSWLVYLSNQIIDPYFQWHLTSEQFKQFILKKYNSIENAQTRVAFYRNNWYDDDSILNVATYNGLSTSLKKYWNPIVGYLGSIGSYERKKVDTILETNKVIELTLNNVTSINEGDRVIQKTSGSITAQGFVKVVRSSSIVINHITGTFANTGGSVGTLTDYNNVTFSKNVSDVTTLSTPITQNEQVYWEQVSYYTYENELNESRKSIKLIDRQYVNFIEDQMIELTK